MVVVLAFSSNIFLGGQRGGVWLGVSYRPALHSHWGEAYRNIVTDMMLGEKEYISPRIIGDKRQSQSDAHGFSAFLCILGGCKPLNNFDLRFSHN